MTAKELIKSATIDIPELASMTGINKFKLYDISSGRAQATPWELSQIRKVAIMKDQFKDTETKKNA